MHLHSCCFVNLNIVFLLFSLKSPSSLLKLLNIKCGKLHPTDKMGRTGAITVDCGSLSVISQEIKRPSYILVASCQSQCQNCLLIFMKRTSIT